jgi:hypothetical protein
MNCFGDLSFLSCTVRHGIQAVHEPVRQRMNCFRDLSFLSCTVRHGVRCFVQLSSFQGARTSWVAPAAPKAPEYPGDFERFGQVPTYTEREALGCVGNSLGSAPEIDDAYQEDAMR